MTHRRGRGSHRADFSQCGNSCVRSPKEKVKAGMVCVGGQLKPCRGRNHLRGGTRKGISGGRYSGTVSSAVVSFYFMLMQSVMSVIKQNNNNNRRGHRAKSYTYG